MIPAATEVSDATVMIPAAVEVDSDATAKTADQRRDTARVVAGKQPQYFTN